MDVFLEVARQVLTSLTLMMHSRTARLVWMLIGISLVGTLGYMMLEDWSFFEAMYMTVITLSTVGFGEVRSLSVEGRAFTTALIAGGVISVTYMFSAISQTIISGEITGTVRRRRMERAIDRLKDHYIVCGSGRVGSQIVNDLVARGKECVEIEPTMVDPHAGDRLVVEGDAAEDDVLQRAGVTRARGLVAATGDDATNLFIIVSAKALNPDLVVVARANQPSSEAKLRNAGATHVVSPYVLSGSRMARQLVSPEVSGFLDTVLQVGHVELAHFTVSDHSPLLGKVVDENVIRRRIGANLLAVQKNAGGKMVTTFSPNDRFELGDVLIALGTMPQLNSLAEFVAMEGTIEPAVEIEREHTGSSPSMRTR